MAIKQPEIVVIESAREDDYGNVFFIDKDEKEHKVGEKRPDAVRDLVLNNPGKAVKLTYKRFQQYDYIDDVELVSDQIKETPKAETPQKVVSGIPTDDIPVGVGVPKASPSESGQERGMWGKELGAWLMLGYKEGGTLKLSDLIGAENALDAARWYRNKLLSVNKIPFDEAKFPFIKKKEGE